MVSGVRVLLGTQKVHNSQSGVIEVMIMRAPFQILAIPYKVIDNSILYCVFHRSDFDQWQFIAGGGEDDESPMQAARREISEESGIIVDKIIELKSMCYIPANIFPKRSLYNWPKDMYVVPEHAFAFQCKDTVELSHEHTECVWLSYEDVMKKLKWDSNKTALYELNCRLHAD